MATEVRSPTTGIIIEIKVRAGDPVALDDEMMIIESMKMHIPVTAPEAGNVRDVMVSEGDQIGEDDVVAVIG